MIRISDFANDSYLRLAGQLAGRYGAKAYLVGGAIRNQLLSKQVKDYDFILTAAAEKLPIAFAKETGGSFFWLDRERLQSRVVVKSEGGLIFDFAGIRGGSLEEDLLLRDFTFNAIAMSLSEGEGVLIDPLDGLSDLHEGTIRVCSPRSLDDDPLRILRACRFAATLGFEIETSTSASMSEKSQLLQNVATERIREEFFRILQTTPAAKNLNLLLERGLLAHIFPFMSPTGLERGIAAVSAAETAIQDVLRLESRLEAPLQEHLLRELDAGVTAEGLVKFCALFADATTAGARKLRLSHAACRFLATAAQGSAPLEPILSGRETEGSFFRFHKDNEPASIELMILFLAAERAGERRNALYDLFGRLLRYRFQSYDPERGDLLSGKEIMDILGISEGPAIGEAIALIREEERRGMVNDKPEAVAFLRKNQLTNR